METKEIRLTNLNQLISTYGSQRKLSDLIDIDSSYLSQIKNKKNPKNIGEKLARKIESTLSLAHGWMDQLHGENEQNNIQLAIQANSLSSNTLQHASMTADEVELIACYKALGKDKKKLLLETARVFKGDAFHKGE